MATVLTRFNNRNRSDKLAILRRLLFTKATSATATWDPASLVSGASTTTTVTVAGAATTDKAYAKFTQTLPDRVRLNAAVTGANTVTVTLVNGSSSTVDLPSGTLTARVEKNARTLATSQKS